MGRKNKTELRHLRHVRAGTADLTRQQRYKVMQYRRGECINCGKPRGTSPFKRVCLTCGNERRAKLRKKRGSRAWKRGGPGCPPLKERLKAQLAERELSLDFDPGKGRNMLVR